MEALILFFSSFAPPFLLQQKKHFYKLQMKILKNIKIITPKSTLDMFLSVLNLAYMGDTLSERRDSIVLKKMSI